MNKLTNYQRTVRIVQTNSPTFIRDHRGSSSSLVPDESKWRELYLSMNKDSRVYIARSVVNSWKSHNNLDTLPAGAVSRIIYSLISDAFKQGLSRPKYLSGGVDKNGAYLTLPIPGDIYGTSTAFLVFRKSDKDAFDYSITTITGPSGVDSMRLVVSDNFVLKNSNNPWKLSSRFIILYRGYSENEDESNHYTAYTFMDGTIYMTLKDLPGVLEDISDEFETPDIQLQVLQN